MAEHRELGDVAAEEERDRPVGDDAELPGEERQLVEVVRPRDEPADEAAKAEAEDVRDPLVAPEGRHLAEHAVAVRLRARPEVLREPPGLAQRVLAGRRVGLAGRRGVRHARAVAERPDVLPPSTRSVGSTGRGRVSSSGRPKRADERRRPHAGGPDERVVSIRSPSESVAASASADSSVVATRISTPRCASSRAA